LLKTTKDIITDLQDKVLDDVLPTHQKSIIQFYLRQVQSFNDVMADLGLFGLMQDILEMYKVIPRNKKKGPPPKEGMKPRAPAQQPEQADVDEEPQIVELDPNKKYNFRAEFTNGYIDPFSGTAPGPEGNSNNKDEQQGSGGDEDFIIYFDMKTGTIGKIPRSECASKSLIVSQTDEGEEEMQGAIEDDDEREKLIWDMKKAMKVKKSGASSKSPGPNRKKYVITPGKDATGRTIGRTKSSENTLKKMQVPPLDKENSDPPESPNMSELPRRTSGTKKTPTATQTAKRPSVQKKEPTKEAPAKRPSGQKTATSKRPSIQKAVKDPKPSNDGWSNASALAAGRRGK
jgi:hypothetical protein